MTPGFFRRVLGTALLFPGLAVAQPSIAVSIAGSADAFRPVGGAAEARRALNGDLRIDSDVASGRGQLYYDLDFGSLAAQGDWSYQLHEVGGSVRWLGSDSSARRVYLTGALATRRHGEAWSSAAYTAAGAGVNLELAPHPTATWRFGYRADARRFPALGALSQLEHRGFASVIANFATRTTLILEGGLGAKSYAGLVADGRFDTVTVLTSAGSRGRGFGAGWSSSGGSSATVILPSTSSQRGTAGLATGMIRIAQSLSDRTGVHVESSARRAFGAVPPLLVFTPAGFLEDGIYDDPFASRASFIATGVKRVFANSAILALDGWWARKSFTSSVALDAVGEPLGGSPLRRDQIGIGRITWAQPLLPSRTGALAVSAETSFRLLRHHSNDALYDYTARVLTLGLTVRY
ncbi:MAG: hypothetical protein FJ191_13160 [Gammaproteobacteria bacterium]|nr:hypothetical protein [Gammaproteobacteria bacterium]